MTLNYHNNSQVATDKVNENLQQCIYRSQSQTNFEDISFHSFFPKHEKLEIKGILLIRLAQYSVPIVIERRNLTQMPILYLKKVLNLFCWNFYTVYCQFCLLVIETSKLKYKLCEILILFSLLYCNYWFVFRVSHNQPFLLHISI